LKTGHGNYKIGSDRQALVSLDDKA